MTKQILKLPVSGLEVMLRQPTGAEDLLLLEAEALDIHLVLELLPGFARSLDGSTIPWEALAVTDLDAMLLLIRRALLGDLIRADALCPAKNCGARIEASFRIGDYLVHHSPRKARGVDSAEEAGWFQFRDIPVSFRLPTGTDQLAIAHQPQPTQELVRRCVRPVDLSTKQLKRVETAMDALAPSLAQNLQGQCSECGARVEIYFDPQQFILQELRNQAAFVYEDIHLLALYYQWSEVKILALPRQRRLHYAEMIRQSRRSA